MSELMSLLAALLPKTAIKEGKMNFLIGRYGVKDLKPYLVQHNLVTLLPEDTPDANTNATNKEQNEAALKAGYTSIIKNICLADPSDKLDKNDYTEWLLKQWLGMDQAHKERWIEDAYDPEDETLGYKGLLSQFINMTPDLKQMKNEAGELKYPVDINSYPSIDELKKVISKLNNATERYPMPPVSESGCTIIYQDGQYVFWQVTDYKDLMLLGSYPKPDSTVWCTRGEGTAKSYLAAGALYVAYKDGEPLFQIDPHGSHTHGDPQFMSRNNKKMHSATMLNATAGDLLNRVVAKGGLSDVAQTDIDKVLAAYKTPNISEAKTFDFLSDYLVVNGSEAKKDPRFIEMEQSYVRPRFLTAPRGMEPDEIKNLTNKYNRTGEATKAYVEENASCKEIIEKVKACTSYTEFLSKGPKGQRPTAEKFTNDQFGLAYRLDGVFKYVFELFDKEHGFSAKFKEFKDAIKAKDAAKAGALSGELVKLLKDKFTHQSGYYDAPLQGFTMRIMREHDDGEETVNFTPRRAVQGYINTIEGLSKPFWKAGFESAITQAGAQENVKDAYATIEEAYRIYTNRIAESHQDLHTEAHRMYDQAIKEVLNPKLLALMASLSKISEVKEYAMKMFPNEMKGSRYPHNPTYREERIPSWASNAFLEKMNELRLLKDKVRGEKEEKAERGEIKLRFSPKREYEKWLAGRTPESDDPVDKVIDFVLTSPSYKLNDQVQFVLKLKDPHPQVEAFVLQNARSIQDHNLIEYMKKQHTEDWPEMERMSPSLLSNGSYIQWKYQGKRIPSKEPELLQVNGYTMLENQLDYIKNHMSGARWPELETRLLARVNQINWSKLNSYSDDPTRLANAVLRYCKEVIKGRWEAIEDKFFDNESYAMKYLYQVLPDAKERIKRLMVDQQKENPAEKISTKKIISSLRKKLI